MCNSTGQPDCMTVFYHLSEPVYPGETISLPAVVVGQDFGTGTGSVYAQYLSANGDSRKQDTVLVRWQYTQGMTQEHCNQLNYSILAAPTNSSTILVLSAVELSKVTEIISNATVKAAIAKYDRFKIGGNPFSQDLLTFPFYINMSVLPCPLGFTLSLPPYKCECSEHLRQLTGVKCHIQNRTFEQSDSTTWIGLDGEDRVIVSKYCPFLFCTQNTVNMTINELDIQCNFNHSGRLCGGCKEKLSLALGSNKCLPCSNRYLFLLVPFALAGITLVFAIKCLDITVSQGYLNGLVFYFNIVHSVRPALAPQGQNYPLAVLVAWMNLDLGIETCFFDGLSVYWKTWLQFLFPLYIWGICGLMIITAKYSIRMSRMMGNNPVSVLATLFLLSYTKLLRTSIMILAYSVIIYPRGQKAVWSLDYLGPKHLPLFVVAVVVLLFLCVPYTLILLLGQWLCRCKRQLISRMMFRIQPIMDAYYGPLKDKHCYWIGLLLLSRHITQALIPNKNSTTLVLAIAIMTVGLLQLTGYVLGFYHSRYVSAFELTILSNLAIHSLAILYTLKMEDETQTVDNLFIAVATTQLGGLVLLCVFRVLRQCLHQQVTPKVMSCFLSGSQNSNEDWEVNEEASHVRHKLLDECSKDNNMETIPINSDLHTYETL